MAMPRNEAGVRAAPVDRLTLEPRHSVAHMRPASHHRDTAAIGAGRLGKSLVQH